MEPRLDPPEEEMVVISKERYDDLLHAEEVLAALYAGGVDNWEWYSESLEDAGL